MRTAYPPFLIVPVENIRAHIEIVGAKLENVEVKTESKTNKGFHYKP